MSIQDALQAAGVISCAVAVLLTLLAFYSFVTQDIPAVLDDLSGRRRMRALENADASMAAVSHTDFVPIEEQTEVMTDETSAVYTGGESGGTFEVCLRIVLCSYSELSSLERGAL